MRTLRVKGSRVERKPLQQLFHAREASLRSFLDAVLHRGVALLGRTEAHRLGQLRPVAHILELERLPVVLERLPQPLGGVDLAELALDDAVRGAEAIGATGTDVHLLDDRAVAPPFRDQLRVCPDGEDVRTRCVEDPLDADLELGDWVRSRGAGRRSSVAERLFCKQRAVGSNPSAGFHQAEEAGRLIHQGVLRESLQKESTWPGNALTSIGLTMKPSKPAASNRSRSTGITDAVTATTLMPAVAGLARR